MFRILKAVITVCLICLSVDELHCQTEQPPNIILIVADDLGYADLGCFGSDIETPNIDSLAEQGTIFTNFYSMPSCAPTRASLLTGVDNHLAGVGSQFYNDENQWGYEGYLTDRVKTIPQVLKSAGYETYMAGKWHLGRKSSQNPKAKGFDKSFVLLQGASSHYSNIGISLNDSISQYTSNGKKSDWPKGGYSTEVYTDTLIKYISEGVKTNRPFFAFAAYTSPHWPLQVEESYWKKYEGRYDDGYIKLRERNLDRLKKAGIISQSHTLPPLHPNIKPWDSLSPMEQKIEARKMELYAGMVDNLDFHVGRLISTLKSLNVYENTVIVFMSDNGAAAEDFYYQEGFKELLQKKYTDAYEDMGTEKSFVSYNKQWAEAGSAPFRNHKQYSYEGGIKVPMIMKLPTSSHTGKKVNEFMKLTDLAPTFYAIANIKQPFNEVDPSYKEYTGKSSLGYMIGDSDGIHEKDEIWTIEHGLRSMLRQGDWKLVQSFRPTDNREFELYNLRNDPIESKDVSAEYPEIKKQLIELWKQGQHDLQIRSNYND